MAASWGYRRRLVGLKLGGAVGVPWAKLGVPSWPRIIASRGIADLEAVAAGAELLRAPGKPAGE